MADQVPVAGKPSQIPSWVMLGFMLGSIFVWLLRGGGRVLPPPPASAAPAAPLPASAAPPRPAAPALPAQQPIETVDNVFTQWGQYAVWSDDTTEIALWDTQTRAFSRCFEVLRLGGRLYFRPIAALTRPVLKHGGPSDPGACPLEFTETEEQQRQWMTLRNDEANRTLNEFFRNRPSDGKP